LCMVLDGWEAISQHAIQKRHIHQEQTKSSFSQIEKLLSVLMH